MAKNVLRKMFSIVFITDLYMAILDDYSIRQ